MIYFCFTLFIILTHSYRLEVAKVPAGFKAVSDKDSTELFILHGSELVATVSVVGKSMFTETDYGLQRISLHHRKVTSIPSGSQSYRDIEDWAAIQIAATIWVNIEPTTLETFNHRLIEFLKTTLRKEPSFSTTFIANYSMNFRDQPYRLTLRNRLLVWRRAFDLYLMGQVILIGNYILFETTSHVDIYTFDGSEWKYENGRHPINTMAVQALALVDNPHGLGMEEVISLLNRKSTKLKTLTLYLQPTEISAPDGQFIDILKHRFPNGTGVSARQIDEGFQNFDTKPYQIVSTARHFTWETMEGLLIGRLMLIGNLVLFETGLNVDLFYDEGEGWNMANSTSPLGSEHVTRIAMVYNPDGALYSDDDLNAGSNTIQIALFKLK